LKAKAEKAEAAKKKKAEKMLADWKIIIIFASANTNRTYLTK
jgi:hypothetical protein